MNKIFLILFNLVAVAYCKEVCYGDLGCFNDQPPFSGSSARPKAVLPQSPEKIAVRFTLFTRENPSGELITYTSIPDNFNPSMKTVFITHGFLHHANKQWVLDMKNALLRADQVNVVTVDWSKGNSFPYLQATGNTLIVGAEIARLVNTLIDTKGVSSLNVHLVGHSLGAHISGYAGSRIKNLGRITGLDPAGPYFEFTEPEVRLDPTDALYVDAIHTDGAQTIQIGLGLMQPVGHVDFYPNGGKVQPNCPQTSQKYLNAIFNIVTLNFDSVEDAVACNHQAAVTYFTESIEVRDCKYYGYQCNSQEEYDRGECLSCSGQGCNSMGYWASPSNEQGRLFLNTLSPLKTQFCTQPYRVKLVSNNAKLQARGTFKIYLATSSDISEAQTFDDSAVTFKPGSTEIRLVSFGESRVRGAIQSVFISYTRTSNFFSSWLYDTEWGFSSVELFSGEEQTSAKFCPTTSTIGSAFVEFKRC